MLKARLVCSTMPLINNIDLVLMPGQITGIVGPNGAGKTTLLKILSGLSKPSSGSVEINGDALSSMSVIERARKISYLEQYSFVHWPLSVSQLIQLGRYPHRDNPDNSPDIDVSIIKQVVKQVGIENLLSRTFNSLSGGERARVLLARALACKADYLLVDEPIASLDLKYQLEIMQLLKNQAKTGSSVGVILHDLNLAAKYCDHIYLLYKGEVVVNGSPEEVFTEEIINNTFDINAKIINNKNSIEIYPII